MKQPDCTKVYNELQPRLEVELLEDEWLAVTYMGHFRLGDNGAGERLELKNVDLLPIMVRAKKPSCGGGTDKVVLRLTHGRDAADEDMEDFGFDYPGEDPVADFVVIKDTGSGPEIHLHRESGVEILKTHGDLVVYEGKFYGDFSVDWKEGD